MRNRVDLRLEIKVASMNFDGLFSSNFPDDSAIAEKVARNVSTRAAEDWKEAVVLSLYDDIFKLKKRLAELEEPNPQ